MATLRLAIDARKAAAGAERFEKAAGRVTRSSNTAASAVRRFAGIIGGGLALRKAVTVLSGFEEVMATVRSVSGATEKQFQDLSKAAREMGATTRFSAKEAGDGLLFLARTGFDTQQAIEALPATLNLAVAGALGLGSAADFASNILKGFNLDASETVRIVDSLIVTSNSANTNVQQLAEAMKFVAPIASNLGIAVEEAAAAIGVLGDAGIQGTMAGTNLRQILLQLVKPTDQAREAIKNLGLKMDDLNPTTNTLAQIFKRLGDAQLSAESAAKIFQVRNTAAALVLAESSKKVRELTQSQRDNVGAAQEQARVMDDTLRGALLRLKSVFEEMILTIGDSGLTGALRTLVDTFSETIRVLTLGGQAAKDASIGVLALAAAVRLLALALTVVIGAAFVKGIKGLKVEFTQLWAIVVRTGVAMAAFGAILLAHPIVFLGTVVAGVVLSFLDWNSILGKSETSLDLHKKAIEGDVQAMIALNLSARTATAALKELNDLQALSGAGTEQTGIFATTASRRFGRGPGLRQPIPGGETFEEREQRSKREQFAFEQQFNDEIDRGIQARERGNVSFAEFLKRLQEERQILQASGREREILIKQRQLQAKLSKDGIGLSGEREDAIASEVTATDKLRVAIRTANIEFEASIAALEGTEKATRRQIRAFRLLGTTEAEVEKFRRALERLNEATKAAAASAKGLAEIEAIDVRVADVQFEIMMVGASAVEKEIAGIEAEIGALQKRAEEIIEIQIQARVDNQSKVELESLELRAGELEEMLIRVKVEGVEQAELAAEALTKEFDAISEQVIKLSVSGQAGVEAAVLETTRKLGDIEAFVLTLDLQGDEEAQAKAEAIVARVRSISDIALSLNIEDDDVTATVENIRSELVKLTVATISLTIEGGALARVAALRKQLEQLREAQIFLGIEGTERARAEVEAFNQQIQAIEDPTISMGVEIRPEVQRQIDSLRAQFGAIDQVFVDLELRGEEAVNAELVMLRQRLRELDKNLISVELAGTATAAESLNLLQEELILVKETAEAIKITGPDLSSQDAAKLSAELEIIISKIAGLKELIKATEGLADALRKAAIEAKIDDIEFSITQIGATSTEAEVASLRRELEKLKAEPEEIAAALDALRRRQAATVEEFVNTKIEDIQFRIDLQGADQATRDIAKVRQELIDLGATADQIEAVTGAMVNLQRSEEGAATGTATITEQLQKLGLSSNIASRAQGALTDGIFRMVSSGDSVEDFGKQFIRIMKAVVVQELITIAVSAALRALLSFVTFGASEIAGASALAANSGVVQQEVSAASNIASLAHGGIVTQPTLALIGESGPEEVRPLGRKSILQAGEEDGAQIIINNRMTVVTRDADSFRRSRSQIFADLDRGVSGSDAFARR